MEGAGVWPTPLNFEIWVHYLGDPEGPLGREIKRILAASEPFTEATADRLLEPSYDYIIDAIDATRLKCYLIAEARNRGLNIITCGGAGGCIDPSRVKICDLARTINDPLLLQVRKRLRQKYGFPGFKRQKFKVDCVYSDELPVFPMPDGSVSCEREAGEDYRLNCDTGFGSATYLTGTVGFFLAAEVVKRIAFAED